MAEREPIAPPDAPDAAVRPPYERIGEGLTRLLETTGGKVVEGFPQFAPKGAMTDYDHATKTLILHPWISPRAKTEALLREAVKRLAQNPPKHRGKKPVGAEPRSWLVQGLVAKHYGMEGSDADVSARSDWSPTLAEERLVKRIVGAIGGGAEPDAAARDGDAESETVFETPEPRRKRAKKGAAEGGA